MANTMESDKSTSLDKIYTTQSEEFPDEAYEDFDGYSISPEGSSGANSTRDVTMKKTTKSLPEMAKVSSPLTMTMVPASETPTKPSESPTLATSLKVTSKDQTPTTNKVFERIATTEAGHRNDTTTILAYVSKTEIQDVLTSESSTFPSDKDITKSTTDGPTTMNETTTRPKPKITTTTKTLKILTTTDASDERSSASDVKPKRTSTRSQETTQRTSIKGISHTSRHTDVVTYRSDDTTAFVSTQLTTTRSQPEDNNQVGYIVGAVVGFCVLVMVVISVVLFCKWKGKQVKHFRRTIRFPNNRKTQNQDLPLYLSKPSGQTHMMLTQTHGSDSDSDDDMNDLGMTSADERLRVISNRMSIPVLSTFKEEVQPSGPPPIQAVEVSSPQPVQVVEVFGPQTSQGIDDFGPQPVQRIEVSGPQLSQGINDFGRQPSQGINDFGPQPSKGINDFGPQPSQGINDFGPQPNQGINDFGPQPSQGINDFGPQSGQRIEVLGLQPSHGIQESGPTNCQPTAELNQSWPQTGPGSEDHYKVPVSRKASTLDESLTKQTSVEGTQSQCSYPEEDYYKVPKNLVRMQSTERQSK